MPKGDIYIGLMSGTSMDAIDTVLVQFNEQAPKIISYEQFSIDEETKACVRQLDTSSAIYEVTKYDAVMGHLFADSVLRVLNIANISADQVTAIGNHGQTILHLPNEPYPRTLQIGDPNIIAHKTKITTVADFRRMDMASGGQGAPLAPAFHNRVFRKENVNRIILNLGGIANITLLPGNLVSEISGFDTGPGNGLLDDWNQRHNDTDMDRDSNWASTGRANNELLKSLLADQYFALPPAKSTGRDYFNLRWLDVHLTNLGLDLAPEDVQATLLLLTIYTIADAIEKHAPDSSEIYVCGGGAHNKRLMQQLQNRLANHEVYDTSHLGLDPDAIEALTFAWLAKQTIEKKAGNERSVTGANGAQILGGVYRCLAS